MSRYLGSAFKRSRRVGISTLETGKELLRRPYGPGQHGKDRKNKLSEYGTQLVEKQKMKFIYGLSEKQLKKLFEKAAKLKGIHGENLFKLLESRLDNIVYRMGLSNSRNGARQLVNHGHINVNGKKVDIASFQLNVGDVVSVRESSKEHKSMKEAVERTNKTLDFVTFDKTKLEGKYIRLPERSELTADVNESLVIEFYNK